MYMEKETEFAAGSLPSTMESSTAPPYYCLAGALTPPSSCDQSPRPHRSSELCSVYRNEISIPSISDPASPVVAAAPDFYSLNVEADTESLDPLVARETALVAEPETPAGEAELPRLEGSGSGGRSGIESPMLQLHKEIVDFCEFLSPTPEELALRYSAIEAVSEVIKYIWPNCTVEVFGSFRTGLYLPNSDIDVVVIGSGIEKPQLGLYALSRALSQKGIATKIQVIASARVPIIKFVEKNSKISFDISFDLQNGPVAAEYIKDIISKWPPIRPLCLILKVFLQQRESNEVHTGGLGSYALLIMIMVSLRIVRERQAFSEHNLGVLLINFFEFYGFQLNTNDVGISCRGEGSFFSKRRKGFKSSKDKGRLISIEDPQAPENDLGKKSVKYSKIRSAFQRAFNTLMKAKFIRSLTPQRSILGTIVRLDPELLARKGGPSGELTFDSLLPGAGVPLEQSFGVGQDMFCNWQWKSEEETLFDEKKAIEDARAERVAKLLHRSQQAVERLMRRPCKGDGAAAVGCGVGHVTSTSNISGKKRARKGRAERRRAAMQRLGGDNSVAEASSVTAEAECVAEEAGSGTMEAGCDAAQPVQQQAL